MEPLSRHAHAPDVSFDGGDLDCGNGLLLLLRKHIDPLEEGQLLEVRSTESSVEEDLPAWCRLTSNPLISWTRTGQQRSFLIAKGKAGTARTARRPWAHQPSGPEAVPTARPPAGTTGAPSGVPAPVAATIELPQLAVLGVGSWPRPRWMLRAIHDLQSARLPEEEFQEIADDAVRLAVQSQLHAGVDIVTDGEQRRDSYANFVGRILENCQLIPLSDLTALVEDPDDFARELEALDVPPQEVRHPVAFGPIARSRPLAVHELDFARSLTPKPIKVALPGPYLLTRILWLECIAERAYATREALAADVVKALRAEAQELIAQGAALVQLDEPVLTEVVFTGPKSRRSFMCGALSEKGDAASELTFARDLLNAVVRGLPTARTALHVCRGNWTPDESAALQGDYRPLVSTLASIEVGTLILELCTPRAGELEVLGSLPGDRRIGVGVVNPKSPSVESVESIVLRARRAIDLFGRDRVLLNPDCGFATFADNPVASASLAEGKLLAIAEAARRLRDT